MFKTKKGITLIALIITIIVLLILAGVTINMVLGENGLFNKAKTSVGKYENAQEMEEYEIANAENEIDSNINGNRDIYSDIQEQISKLKPKKIDEQSLIFIATNNDYTAGQFDFENWTKTYRDNFSQYFTYDSTNRKMICNKEGWYIINMKTSDGSENSGSASTSINCYINDILVSNCLNVGSKRAVHTGSSNSLTIYLYNNDSVYIKKHLSDWTTYSYSTVEIFHQ